MSITETILANADVSTQEGLDQLQKDMNIAAAQHLAGKISSMDYFSAQLRLVHLAHLRDGDFDAERLRTIVAHLQEVQNIAGAIIPLAASLTPTQPAEVPAEKEQTT